MNTQFWHRNASTVLTCLGGVGLVATSIMAAKATPKAINLINEAEEEKGDELSKWETVQIAGPKYIPTILVGAGTLACIFGANVLNKRHQAALVSAYSLIDSSYKQYRQKVVELYGKETHEEIMDAIAAEKAERMYIKGNLFGTECDTRADVYEGEELLFYDEYGERFFTSTMERVLNAEYHLDRNYVLRGYAVLNEFYDFLGLEPTDFGSEVGWAPEDESMYWIEFDHKKTTIKGVECIIIRMPFEPTAGYEDYSYW